MKKFWNKLALLLCLLAGFGFVLTACSHGSSGSGDDGSDDDDSPVVIDDGDGSSGQTTGGSDTDTLAYAGPASVPDVTLTAPDTAGTITMNGTAYDSIQAAFNAATSAGDYVITLTAGTYEEDNLVYNGAGNIVISGVAGTTYGTDVVIKGKGDNSSSSTEKTRCTLEFIGTSSNSLVLENLAIQNTFKRAEATSSNTQCEALGFDSTGTCAAYNCSFLSHQDTIRTVGKAWFYGCYIEGDVDFIWMEKTGKVALYENCAIKSVSDESSSAYIAAPGMNSADVINKGLVVYNSAVKADLSGTFLFRNPWGVSEGLYNIAAFVNVNIEGTLADALQKSTASNYNLDSNGAIGWKVDKDISDAYASKSSEINVISEAVEKAEYNGRTRIINRVYKLNPEKYANDTDEWDVNELASSRSWSVVTDKSALDSEEDAVVKANGTYNIVEYHTGEATQGTAMEDGTTTDGYVSWTGLKYHSSGYGAYASGNTATISIQVAGSSVISLVGSSYGSGTLTMKDEAGNVYLDAYSTKYKTDKTAISFIYDGGAETTLTLTLTPTTYVGALTVAAYDGEQQKVTKIVVAGDDAVMVDNTVALTATVTTQYCAPETVTWSSSDESVATVSASGVVTGVAEGEAYITATSTFDTTKSASLKVSVSAAKSAKATWLDNTEASFVGASSDETMITVSDAYANTEKTSDTTVTGSYAYNKSKLAGEGVSLTTSDTNPLRDDWYIEYPITAVIDVTISKVSINWGNPGTGNCRAYVTYIDDEGTSVIDDSMVVARSTVNVSSTFVVNKDLAAGKSGKIRISLFGETDIGGAQTFAGKYPTWGTTTITVLDNSAATPVAGTTYTWDFLGDNMAKYKANTTGGTFDTFLTAVITGGWQGDNYGYNVKTGDTFTVTVIGSVNVKVSSSYTGNGYTITTTGSGSLSTDDTGAVGNGGSTLNGAYGEVNYTAASDSEVCTITFTSKGQNYCNGVTVTPAE